MSDRQEALASHPFPPVLAAALKQATEIVHLRLHHHPLLVQLHQTSLSRQGYRTVLEAFHQFYSLWEPAFSGMGHGFAHEAIPLEWLEQDFAALGLPCPHHPTPYPASSALSVSQAIGYLYVKQGSTLGGQRISRHVQQQLGLKPGEAQFFFHGFGSRTGPHWKAFLQYLAQVERDCEISTTEAIASAVRAFESLEAILGQKALHVSQAAPIRS